jgi:histidinol-phosphatase
VGIARSAWPVACRVVIELTLVGGPTARLRYAGLTWLTDPTFSPPGEYAGGLVKTTGPALGAEQLGAIDVVLLSHDQHSDNLDPGGRDVLGRAARVLSTPAAAQRLGAGAIGLEPWASIAVPAPGGGAVTVTAVPARHGPEGCEPLTGSVTGFVLAAPGLETVYISGDNASLELVQEIAVRFPRLDVALLFAGAVQLPQRFGGAYLTLSCDHAAEAARALGASLVVALHFEGWTHFTQGADALVAAFAGNGLADRLILPERGRPIELMAAEPAGTLSDLELALTLADLADAITMRRFRAADLVVETKPDLTPVSEADRAVELALRARIAAAREGDGVLGEEFGAGERSRAGAARRWVIDPIDGTKSYVRGLPTWSTLIALQSSGESVLGVVSMPAIGRRWWAERGTGAYVREHGGAPRRIAASRVATLGDAQLCWSGIEDWDAIGHADALLGLARACWRTRGIGDAWQYMLVAEGAAEIALDPQVSLWDLAAPQVVVEEAGGRFSDLTGAARPDGGSGVASNGLLHDAVLAALALPGG